MAVALSLETLENWQLLDNSYNAEWIQWQWVEMGLKKCASEILEVRRNRRQGNQQLAMDLGQHASKNVRSDLPELPNTTFMVAICWVWNGKDIVLAPKQLQALYTDVRHWEKQIEYIDKTRGP